MPIYKHTINLYVYNLFQALYLIYLPFTVVFDKLWAIIPSRWFLGGHFLNDRELMFITVNTADIFHVIFIRYFVWSHLVSRRVFLG